MKNPNKFQDTPEIIEFLFNSMPFSYVYWKNTNGIYLGASTNQLQLFDKDSKGFIGKTIFEILDNYDSAKAVDDIDNKIMHEGIPVTIEESVITPNGEKKIFLSQKQPVRDSKKNIIGMIGFSIDITERKKLEEDLIKAKEAAEVANKTKTEFLENMRHDIRTPLTGIVGFANILKLEVDNPTIKEYAGNIAASSNALLDLMDEVLEAVRVSSGEIPRLKKKFDLKSMFTKVIDLYRAKAGEKKLQLNFLYANHLPQYVIGDKIRLHRIVLELIGNALNFTHTGHVTLNVELAQKEKRNLIIKIEVTDTGIGIDKDKQQDIYLQFKRLTPSYQGLYKGTGLGLYIVKQFIEELDAEIYVNSSIGEGTTFTCVIPLKMPLLNDHSGIEGDEVLFAQPNLSKQLGSNPISNSKLKSNKILVVEDNIIAQKVAQTLLNTMNCNVDLASSGQAAIQKIRNNQYDLIFMDIGLGDGDEVTKKIRKLEKENKHTPIVALTAHAAEESKNLCIEAGMDAVLAKPITKKHAWEVLSTFIKKIKLPRNY